MCAVWIRESNAQPVVEEGIDKDKKQCLYIYNFSKEKRRERNNNVVGMVIIKGKKEQSKVQRVTHK